MSFDPNRLKDSVKSKKLWFSVGCILTLLLYPILTIKFPALAPLYDTFAGTVVAICGLFLTGNIANKWAISKITPKQPENRVDDPDAT